MSVQTDQINLVLERLLGLTDKLLVQYQNLLLREEFDANRLVTLEDIGSTTANGSIVLTSKIAQPVLITGIRVNIDTNLACTLTIDRFTQTITNAQQRDTVIAPVQYIVGPGQIVKLSWSSAPTVIPYFAVYGKLIGSHFG